MFFHVHSFILDVIYLSDLIQSCQRLKFIRFFEELTFGFVNPILIISSLCFPYILFISMFLISWDDINSLILIFSVYTFKMIIFLLNTDFATLHKFFHEIIPSGSSKYFLISIVIFFTHWLFSEFLSVFLNFHKYRNILV